MIKRIIDFFKKYFHFKFIEVPLAVIFIAIASLTYYCISTLPNQKFDYISQKISILSKNSETDSVPIYFDENLNANPDSTNVVKNITNFNALNNRNSGIKEYKQLVCANLDDEEVKINALEDKSPAVIMTAWSTFYYDKDVDDNVFMSNLIVEGLGTTHVSDYYFCYITKKQADYLIQHNTEFNTYSDLINEKIELNISFEGKSKTETFAIRDIIKSDVGNDARYNELFGSYIVCYYWPFLKTTKFQMFYDLSKDENRNLSILNEAKENYSNDLYNMKFLRGIDNEQADEIKSEFFSVQTTKDNSILVIVLLFVAVLFFVITTFFACEYNNKIKLSFALLLFGVFASEYILLKLLVKAKIMFAVRLFSSFGILCNVGFLGLNLLVICISAFVKENTKFSRKYVNEKNIK